MAEDPDDSLGDIYDFDTRESLVDSDEETSAEQGFMNGYREAELGKRERRQAT